MKQQKQYQGVWIPKEIFDNPELGPREIILLAEIETLDNGEGCFASNEHLARRIGVSEGTIANMLTSLRKRGFLIDRKFDGRKRYVSAAGFTNLLRQGSRIREGRVHENVNIDNSIENRREVTKVTESKALFGDKKVSGIVNYWKQTTKLPISELQKQRNAASILLKTFSYDEVRALIDVVESSYSDKFAPKEVQCSSLMELARHKQKVMIYAKKRQHNQGGAIYV